MEKCLNCGEEFKKEDMIPVYDLDNNIVGYICEDCVGEGYHYCAVTGKVFAEEDLIYVRHVDDFVNSREVYTSGRYRQCDDCEEWFPAEDVFSDGCYTICERCYDRNCWSTCDNCSCLIPPDRGYWDDDAEAMYCDECYATCRAEAHFHDYSYKPNPVFRVMPGEYTKLFYGIELETDNGECRDEYCDDLFSNSEDGNLFYMKEDGSLNHGVEIVSHPCSLDFHLNKFPWERVRDIALEYGYRSHDTSTCGLHVHVSRNALGDNATEQDLTIAKIIMLFDKFWDNIVKFSRRNYSALDSWSCKPNADIQRDDNDEVVVQKSKHTATTRYRAVNLTNYATIEFRVFRGSLKVNTIKATLEFLDNLIHYAMSHTVAETQDADWADVVGYKAYDELSEYLASRGIN